MTDPTGRSFLSYRRSRLSEARLLIAHQHDLGIPTWQDVEDLDEEPTEESIRGVLKDSATANAVMWLTPDVAQSPMIRAVEAPLIIERFRRQDSFFVVPVAAGGLDYEDAARVVGERIGIEDLNNWNLRKVSSNPLSDPHAREVAIRVLSRRVQAIHNHLPGGEPLRVVFNTRTRPPFDAGIALTLDWTHRFEGREATSGAWDSYLLPALTDIAGTIQQRAPDRSVVATGLLAIPAAIAFGYEFMAPRGLRIAWEQLTSSGDTQTWAIADTPEDSGFEAGVMAGQMAASDLAVLVSVNADVSLAVSETQASLPPFRALLHVKHRGEEASRQIASAGQAVHLARLIANSARKVREEYRVSGRVHLFIAGPVGLAMLVGQLLNTLGQVQTYEHIPEGALGYYSPAALLG